MAAVELDIASAVNRHNDIIDRPNAVHLFSDWWPVRRWASAWIAEQKTAQPPDVLFKNLETISLSELNGALSRDGSPRTEKVGSALRVGSISRATFDSPVALAASVSDLGAAYVDLDTFIAPYLEVTG